MQVVATFESRAISLLRHVSCCVIHFESRVDSLLSPASVWLTFESRVAALIHNWGRGCAATRRSIISHLSAGSRTCCSVRATKRKAAQRCTASSSGLRASFSTIAASVVEVAIPVWTVRLQKDACVQHTFPGLGKRRRSVKGVTQIRVSRSALCCRLYFRPTAATVHHAHVSPRLGAMFIPQDSRCGAG